MSTPYEIRTNDVGKSRKQSMAELKLRRLTELNQRLQEDLNRRRIPVSEASMEYVSASHQQRTSITNILAPVSLLSPTRSPRTSWYPVDGDRYAAMLSRYVSQQTDAYKQIPKGEDPYAPQQSNGCCTVM